MNKNNVPKKNNVPLHSEAILPLSRAPRVERSVLMRRRLGAAVFAGLAILGVGKAANVVAKDAPTAIEAVLRGHTGHEYTDKQLASMPQTREVVQYGEGPWALVEKVDPQLADDPQALEDVGDYVGNQGPNHVLRYGQVVEVPIISKK